MVVNGKRQEPCIFNAPESVKYRVHVEKRDTNLSSRHMTEVSRTPRKNSEKVFKRRELNKICSPRNEECR
jgi:hypothetical protein